MNANLASRFATSLALCAALAACSASNDPPRADAATDTPTTDAPVTDVPSTDVPPTDVPVTDVPSTDVPRTDVPATDVPSTDVPVTDASADVPADAPQTTDALRVAYVAPGDERRPAIWIQRPDGTMRRQLHFTGVTDDVPAQDERVPAVSDARVISVHQLAWSPDGIHLAAVVSTALDQSEVVVLDVDHGGGFVASANGQYVMPALDWSPDGRRLALVMSTQPHAGGLELVEADLAAHRWRFLTERASLRGLSIVLRYDAAGATLTYSRIDSEEPTSPWNSRSSLHRVNVETRVASDVAADLVGRIDGLSRDGATAYLLRTLRAGTDGSRESALIARTLAGGAEATVFDGSDVALAAQGPYDGALLVASGAAEATAWRALRPGGETVRVDVPGGAERVALWAPAQR